MTRAQDQATQQIQAHRNFSTICNTHAEAADQQRSNSERKALKFQGMLECLNPLIKAIDERLDTLLNQETLVGPAIAEARAIRGLVEHLKVQAIEHGNKAAGEIATLSALHESYKNEALAHNANIRGFEQQAQRTVALEERKTETTTRKGSNGAAKTKKSSKSARSSP